MSRSRIMWRMLESVFLLVFLIFFFTLTETRDTSTWLAFSFVVFAYFVLLAVPSLVRKGKAEKDYRRPLYVLAGLYFIIAFFLNVGVLFAQPVSTKFVILSNIALFGLFAIALLVHLLANENTADQQERRQAELNYVKDAPLRLRLLKTLVKDPDISKLIEKTAENISFSPARSSSSVRYIEERIFEEIGKLETTLPTDSAQISGALELISALAKQRNMILNSGNDK